MLHIVILHHLHYVYMYSICFLFTTPPHSLDFYCLSTFIVIFVPIPLLHLDATINYFNTGEVKKRSIYCTNI